MIDHSTTYYVVRALVRTILGTIGVATVALSVVLVYAATGGRL